jgi:O-antigen/teichoic acid export membrane protein
MGLLKKNIAANFAGSICQAIMGVIFVPLYIKFMGIESWGLVGFFAMLQVMSGLLDMGLSSTINREMARLSISNTKHQEMRNLVRTLEILYWAIAIFVGIIFLFFSPIIARHWIKAELLSFQTIKQALLIMGFVIALQMPSGFYSGGLMGLQCHLLLNMINIVTSSLRGVGTIIILWLISPTIQAFLIWQIVISIGNTISLALFLWRKLPSGETKAIFQKQLLKGIWKFSVGMSGVAAFALILSQMDKVILSRMLSLENFGYYTLASMVAMSLGRLITPVLFSIYPRFTQLVAIDNQVQLEKIYHKSCQLMSVIILPVAIVVAFFSYEFLFLWTHNSLTAQKSYLIVSFLICGTALNGLLNPPFALQLAYGWTRLSLLKTLISVILLVPLIIYLTIYYGAPGAASVWLVLNLGMILFEIPIMHRRLLPKEKWTWYSQDVCLPLFTCIILVGFARIFITMPIPPLLLGLYLISIYFITLSMVGIITPATRLWLFNKLHHIKLAFYG